MPRRLIADYMVVFSLVVEHNGFTAAARVLGVPKVQISRAISALERALGQRVLERTTRRIHITEAGRAILAHCQRMALEIEAAQAALVPVAAGTSLRVSLDQGYGRVLAGPLVPRFLERYPDVVLRVLNSGEDGADNFDVQLRSDGQGMAGHVVVPLAKPPLVLCASPTYLAGRVLRAPSELSSHALLWATSDKQPTLRLAKGGGTVEVRCTPRLSTADPVSLHAAVAAGLGIGVLPEFMCRNGFATRRLVRVMPEWQVLERIELQALSPPDRAEQPVVRSFIEFIRANAVPAMAAA